MDMLQLAIIVVVAMVNLGLAVAVYLRNKRSASNRAFAAAVSPSCVGWASRTSPTRYSSADYALLLNRLTIASAMVMGAFLLRFALIFPARDIHLPRPWMAYMWAGVLLSTATLTTPLVVAEVRFRTGGTDVLPGPGFGLLIAWACVGAVGCVFALAKKYRTAQGHERTQLKFMVLSIAAFAVSSVLLGLILPSVTGSYSLARLNNLSTLLLVSLISYSIIKHRFMDIRLVVLRGATYTLLMFVAGAGLVWLAFYAGDNLSGTLHVRSRGFYLIGSLVAVFAFQPVRRGIETPHRPGLLPARLPSLRTPQSARHLDDIQARRARTRRDARQRSRAQGCGSPSRLLRSRAAGRPR